MSVRAKFVVVATVAATLSLLVEYRTPGLNGSPSWQWAWRRIDPIRVVAPMMVAALPLFWAQWRFISGRRQGFNLALVTISLFMLMLAAAGVQKFPFHLKRLAEVIALEHATSYYSDAAEWMSQPDGPSLGQFLATYPQRMQRMHLHSRLRPPGIVLFHAMSIRLFGAGYASQMAAGLAIVLFASATAPATFLLIRQLVPESPDAAFHAACLVALSPALVWFVPLFDQVYPVLAALLLCLWMTTLRNGSWVWAVCFGVAFATILLITFNLLVLGVFLVGAVVVRVWRGKPGATRSALRQILFAGAAAAAVYLLLWICTGYSAIAVFFAALRNQSELASAFDPPRPYPMTVPFDLLDFLLGAGWIAAPLVGFYAANPAAKPTSERSRWMVWLALLQILGVALSGALAVETARVWIFLLPLLALPIGLELSTWGRRERVGVYIAQFALMTSIGGNMWFIVP